MCVCVCVSLMAGSIVKTSPSIETFFFFFFVAMVKFLLV